MQIRRGKRLIDHDRIWRRDEPVYFPKRRDAGNKYDCGEHRRNLPLKAGPGGCEHLSAEQRAEHHGGDDLDRIMFEEERIECVQHHE